jgi:sugar/nucleoside kinase (ribokinase family)
VNPGSAGSLADLGVDAVRYALDGVDIVITNLDEGRVLTSETASRRIAEVLAERHRVAVLTRGGDGVLVAETGAPLVALPAAPAEVVDPTGAGDAFTAGFLDRWIRRPEAVEAASAGLRAAARCLGILGGRPPAPTDQDS